MKRSGKEFRKSKIFNSVNIILIAVLFVEFLLVANWVMTGEPVRSGSEPNLEGIGVNTNTVQDNNFEEPKFNGYIVQLKDDPVSKYYINQKQNKALSNIKIQENTNNYRKNLVDKQNSLESKIKNLYPKAKVDSKVQNVFNGFAIFDISDEEARQLENLEEVEKVYRNYKVYTTLMDSVPLINADDVWSQVDLEGRQITGEGITIGIIDTGVDYTHPDLGGCPNAPVTINGNVFPYYLESDANLSEGYVYYWTVIMPGLSNMAIHFEHLSLSAGARVSLIANNQYVDIYSFVGTWSNFWTVSFPGDTLIIAYYRDSPSVYDDGFIVDSVLNGSAEKHFPPCNKTVGGWDFLYNDADPMDDHGHGTHVAAIAAGNGILKGVAPGAEIYAYKVLDSGGGGYWSDVINAITRSTDPNQDGNFSDHLDVISMSFGGYGNSDDALSQAVDNAVDLGVVAVVSAGNSGPDGDSDCRHSNDWSGSAYSICSPGTARKAITVGASDKSDIIAGFSSRGPTINGIQKPDITAPGVNICAAQYDSAWNDRKCLDDKHISISGTSMATPIVTGAVALVKQAHPDWTPEQIKQALKNWAKNLGYDINTQGAGRLDVLNSLIRCTDTDGGTSPTVRGTVTATNMSGTFSFTDSCSEPNYVLEYYCRLDKKVGFQLTSCAYGCSGGVCNQISPGKKCYWGSVNGRKTYICPKA